MSIAEFLNKLPAALNAEAIDGVDCVVQLNVSAPYTVKVCDGRCEITEGTNDDADVTLTLSDENLIALLTGKLAGAMAFMTGKLKLDGDLMLAKEITTYFDPSKLA